MSGVTPTSHCRQGQTCTPNRPSSLPIPTPHCRHRTTSPHSPPPLHCIAHTPHSAPAHSYHQPHPHILPDITCLAVPRSHTHTPCTPPSTASMLMHGAQGDIIALPLRRCMMMQCFKAPSRRVRTLFDCICSVVWPLGLLVSGVTGVYCLCSYHRKVTLNRLAGSNTAWSLPNTSDTTCKPAAGPTASSHPHGYINT